MSELLNLLLSKIHLYYQLVLMNIASYFTVRGRYLFLAFARVDDRV